MNNDNKQTPRTVLDCILSHYIVLQSKCIVPESYRSPRVSTCVGSSCKEGMHSPTAWTWERFKYQTGTLFKKTTTTKKSKSNWSTAPIGYKWYHSCTSCLYGNYSRSNSSISELLVWNMIEWEFKMCISQCLFHCLKCLILKAEKTKQGTRLFLYQCQKKKKG